MNQGGKHQDQLATGPSPNSEEGPPSDAQAFRPTDRRSDFPGVTAYRILHQLLARQIGRDSMEQLSLADREETRVLLRQVITASTEGIVQLEMLARLPPSIVLGERPRALVGVPAGATSQAVESVLAWRDSRLLLARSQSLSCAWYLAGEAALGDQQLERSGYLRSLGALMKDLHRRTVGLMRSQLNLMEE